jgi:hypothetical protein
MQTKSLVRNVLRRVFAFGFHAPALRSPGGAKHRGRHRNRLARVAIVMAFGTSFVGLTDAATRLVDISQDNGRKDVLTRDAINWLISSTNESSIDLGDGVRATLSTNVDSVPLQGVLWKGGLDTGATLSCDGVRVTGAELTLRLTGLTPGQHRLSLASNTTDKDAQPDFTILVGDDPTGHPALQPLRSPHDEDAWISSFEFVASESGEFSVRLVPAHGASLTLSGFELDGPNRLLIPTRRAPANHDEHVAQRRATLSWAAAADVTSHHLYFADSRDAVESATTGSSSFMGLVQQNNWTADSELDPAKTYYWRVDSVRPEGVIKGETYRFRVAQLAFPGAEGYGRFARGGRHGRVIYVTSLEDSGPGTLREAVNAEGPRTIVFRTGGTIHLKDRLVIRNPYCTVAGQTAPGDGIAVRGAAFGMGSTHDVIMRYVRLRVGDESGKTWDGMGMAGSDHCIIDHCSIAWSIDEGVSSRGAKNITFQRNIIAEPLNMSVHEKYKGSGKGHGYAGSISGNVGSFHHNLIAHAAGRNWSLAGGLTQGGRFAGYLDLRNNVVYNWSTRTNDGGVRMANIVGNYYIPGPATKVYHLAIAKMELRLPDDVQEYYIADNIMEGRNYDADNWANGGVVIDPNDLGDMKLTEPFCKSYITERSAKDAYKSVMADVGANYPRYDSVDQRAINDTLNRTHTFKGGKTNLPGIPDSQTDVGGFPELKTADPYPDTDMDGMDDRWEKAQGLDPTNPEDRNATDKDGWTNLERFLNGMVAGK